MSNGWIRDDAGADAVADGLYLPELRRRVDERGDQTADLAGRFATDHPDAETVLDLACGPGVHAVELAKRGFSVRGLDVSRRYVELAHRNAAEAGVADRTEFVVGDMRDLDARGMVSGDDGDSSENRDADGSEDRDDGGVPGSVDVVTNRYNSFGYFSDRVNHAVIAAVHERLRESGVIVLELRNRAWVADRADRRVVRSLDGQERVTRREFDPDTGRLTETVDVYEGAREDDDYVGSYTTDTRLYSPAEMRRIFEQVGFETTLAGTLGGDPLPDCPEWFVVFGVRA